jgi:hypothetical protein
MLPAALQTYVLHAIRGHSMKGDSTAPKVITGIFLTANLRWKSQ